MSERQCITFYHKQAEILEFGGLDILLEENIWQTKWSEISHRRTVFNAAVIRSFGIDRTVAEREIHRASAGRHNIWMMQRWHSAASQTT
uniref:Uncharacterized protein n=1 Tax=Setaria digitata TaxID=48799 RepID=A0A915PME4_9BILA